MVPYPQAASPADLVNHHLFGLWTRCSRESHARLSHESHDRSIQLFGDKVFGYNSGIVVAVRRGCVNPFFLFYVRRAGDFNPSPIPTLCTSCIPYTFGASSFWGTPNAEVLRVLL